MAMPCVTRREAAEFIDRECTRPQSNKVLHTHPSPLYWRPADGDAGGRWRRRAAAAAHLPIKDNLYLGLPFCIPTDPPHCGFCLFPTQDFRGKGQIDEYLGWLEREADMFGELLAQGELSSIYVGGGTPNLMRGDDYSRVLRIARQLYGPVAPGIEKTLEGIPQLFTPDKIDAIRAAGFNRVSMGVQQMNDRLIRFSGRKQTRRQVLEAIAGCEAAGLSCNVDLIFGWPEQTLDDMLQDLRELVDLGVAHITHYQLNIAGRSEFSKSLRGALPSPDLVAQMYEESCRFLAGSGFRQATVYDWERTGRAAGYEYEAALRNPLQFEGVGLPATHNMIGLGSAAISLSHAWPMTEGSAWSQMNARSLDAYYGAIDAGRFPVEKQFIHQQVDFQLVWLFQSMQSMHIDRAAYARAFGSDLHADFAPVWEELEHRSWVSIEDHAIRFVGLGAFHVPMLQALLSSARLRQLRAHLPAMDRAGVIAIEAV